MRWDPVSPGKLLPRKLKFRGCNAKTSWKYLKKPRYEGRSIRVVDTAMEYQGFVTQGTDCWKRFQSWKPSQRRRKYMERFLRWAVDKSNGRFRIGTNMWSELKPWMSMNKTCHCHRQQHCHPPPPHLSSRLLPQGERGNEPVGVRKGCIPWGARQDISSSSSWLPCLWGATMLKKRLILPNWEKWISLLFVAVAISSRSLSLTWPVDPFAAVAPCLVFSEVTGSCMRPPGQGAAHLGNASAENGRGGWMRQKPR